MNRLIRVVLPSFAMLLVACSEPAPKPDPAAAPAPAAREGAGLAAGQSGGRPSAAAQDGESKARGPAALAERGRAVYTANCIVCHNPDPSIDGAIGPSIAGSAFELIEARVMRNEYPVGYTPKRDTRAMIPLPYLEKDLAALTAYLAR